MGPRRRPSTEERTLELCAAIAACRSSLAVIERRVATLPSQVPHTEDLAAELRSCSARLDHALAELAKSVV